MSCDTCYEVSLPACAGVITVNVGMDPNNIYTWIITDKFGNKYQENVTTDGAGKFVIDASDLPDGLFTPSSGTFILAIINSAGETQSMAINGEDYTCISMSFYQSNLEGNALNDASVIPNPADSIASPSPYPSFFVQEMEYEAAENIAQYNVITNEFKKADSSVVGDADKILALSITTTTSGNDGVAVVAGKVVNPAWTWTIDADVYLNGTSLSQTAPLIGFVVVIGKATRADAIVVNIGTPTLL